MFQLLKAPNFNFMSKSRVLLGFSVVLMVLCVVILAVRGLNLGIEFQGGTEIRVKFAETPDVARIRSVLQEAGLKKETVTTLGGEGANEIYIRLAADSVEGTDGDLTSSVTGALRAAFGGPDPDSDLNIMDESTLNRLLEQAPGVSVDQAEQTAQSILALRKETAIFSSVEDLNPVPDMPAEALEFLKSNAFTGPFAIRSQGYVGPAVGQELMNKAMGAIFGSLIGMLIYIWIRFQLQWGFAAVVALAHDTLITLGLFSLFKQEMSLSVVAAFLTLVGYSVNDTVVVFDRIRENLRLRKTESLQQVINKSINQTLSRTIITSGLTWVVVLGLFLFGGAALRPFSFVLTVGVVVGTYSSIYVAAPILVLWKQYLSRRQEAAEGSSATAARKAKKIPSSSTG